MSTLAFCTPPLPLTPFHRPRPRTTHPFSPPVTPSRPLWRASSLPPPPSSSNDPEDDALSRELRAKVNELFGGRHNVTIDIEPDSDSGRVQFTVRNRPLAAAHAQHQAQVRMAWNVITSIAVMSVVAGLAFVALFYSGAVHGAGEAERRYEMPTYGKSSYVDPYRLLEEERQAMQEGGEVRAE